MRRKNLPPEQRHTVSTILAVGIIGIQQKWAAFMSRKTRHWKTKQKTIFFIVLCLVFAAANSYVIFQVVDRSPQQKKQIPLLLPAMLIPQAPIPHSRPVLTPTDADLIRRFHHALDSLTQTEEGRRQIEQFKNRHPGLLDSLDKIEKTVLPSFDF